MDQQPDHDLHDAGVIQNDVASRKAAMEAVHAQAVAAFNDLAVTDDAGDGNAEPWSSREIADRVMMNNPDDDAMAMRVLAGRIAAGPRPQSSDPLHELKDFGCVLVAIASATSSIIEAWHDPADLEPEEIDEYRKTVQSLVTAAQGMDELAGWF